MKEIISIFRSVIAVKLISLALTILSDYEFRKSLSVFIVNHLKELEK